MSKLVRCLFIFLFSMVFLEGFAEMRLIRTLINGNQVTNRGQKIELKAADNDLILEFSTVNQDSVTYQYQLDGIDDKWIATTYPTASYQDLAGGSYLFRIKALVKGTETSPTEITIVKQKAFWHEWWFIPLMVVYVLVLIGVGIYLFFLYDFRQKLKMAGVRNQIAADLHDEVGSNLNSIAIFVEVLRKKAPTDMLPILEKIIENSRESVSLMQDTVWTINPKNDSVAKLFERMNSFASQVLSSKDIAFQFKIEANPVKMNFSMEQRKNIYLIFKEAVNNIVKHANATKVSVQISSLRDYMEISIEDNGQGFDTKKQHEGNGLYNFEERAQEAEIALKIESELDKGTTISMKIPA